MVITNEIKNMKVVTQEDKTQYDIMFSNSDFINFSLRRREIIYFMLKKLNISRFLYKKQFDNITQLRFNQLTLLVLPTVNNIIFCDSGDEINNLNKTIFLELKDIYSKITNYKRLIMKIYKPLDNSIKRIVYNGAVIGDYYPIRNILILNFNIVYNYILLGDIVKTFNFLDKILKLNNIILTTQQLNIEEIQEEYMQQALNNFNFTVSDKIKNTIDDINKCNVNIESYNRHVVSEYSKMRMLSENLPALQHFKENILITLKQQIEEIKQLHFVKNVFFNNEGIEVEVGDISLSHNNKKCYVGYFTILITPTNIKMYNKYEKNKKSQHPHVDDNRLCLGNISNKVNKLLGEVKLKELIFILYQFLLTYTHNSTYPHSRLEEWIKFREKEKKFDEFGNSLKK